MRACTQCGKCCIQYADGGLTATEEEIAAWEEHRPDIYAYVSNGEIWISPQTGKQLEQCPWLEHDAATETYGCKIYHHRPEDCRHYPVSIEDMIKDECEMLEVQDLSNRKKAQTTLDELMADSRPPYARP